MTSLSATPSTLAAVLAKALGGETVALASGSYGDVVIKRRTFAEPIRLVSADPAEPAVLRSLTIAESEGITLDGLAVRLTPTLATVAGSAVVYLNKSKRISILGGEVTSGAAINGVPEAATALDKTENVIGWPTCHGVTVLFCEDVLIEGVELHHLYRGSNVGGSARVTYRGNHIHHLRKSGIVGIADDLLIEGNRIHSAKPWRYGQTPAGDHGDWIALWNGGATPIRNVRIRDNHLSTGDGVPMMGGWIQGQKGKIIGFEYSGQVLVGGDHQGFVVSDCEDGLIKGNLLLQDVPRGKPIGIIVGDRCARVTASDNIAGSVSDKSAGATGNVLTRNLTVQSADPAKAGYFTPELATRVAAIVEPAAARLAALRATFPALAPPETPSEPEPQPPVRDVLREALALRTGAKLEPLKTKGRLIIEFKTPAQAKAALDAL